LPIGFAMARLKQEGLTIANQISGGLADRLRDGAIETKSCTPLVHLSQIRLADRLRDGAIETPLPPALRQPKCAGLPIGFAMARLKLSRHSYQEGNQTRRLADRLRDGAIETEKSCERVNAGDPARLADRLRDGAIETPVAVPQRQVGDDHPACRSASRWRD